VSIQSDELATTRTGPFNIHYKAATVLCPPSTDKFDKLIHGKPKPAKRPANQKPFDRPLAPRFHYGFNRPNNPLRSESPTNCNTSESDESDTYSGRKRSPPPTPLRTIPPAHYRTVAMHNFLDWASQYFEDERFNAELFNTLHNEGVAFDLFLYALEDRHSEDQLLDILRKDCGLTGGFSLQLTKACRRWGESLRNN
jgi:hypothetical protein